MLQSTTTLSKGYQITLPSAMRKVLNLEAGDKIVLEESKGGILLKKGMTREEKIKAGFEKLERLKVEREKTMTPEQKAFAKMSAGWTINQYHEHFDNLPETKAYMEEKYGVKGA